MPAPKGPDPFPEARLLLERALESERGIRIVFNSPETAFRTRMNCYTVRTRDRERAMEMYPEGDPRHARTAYDVLSIHMEDRDGNRITNVKGPDYQHIRALVIAKSAPTELEVEEL